jgi:superfamily II DNA or RNA helicase
VTVSDEAGRSPPAATRARLEEALTYFERHYDYTAETPGAFSYVERKLYATDQVGRLMVPLGLKARVAALLRTAGHPVSHRGDPLTALNPAAHAPDWDGLLAEFELFHGQDECLAKIAAAEGGVIAAPTGAGKSTMMRMLCRLYPKARVHVTTKSATLAEEIRADLARVIPDVGFVGAGRKRVARVTVFIADSLHHGMGEADLLLADELHQLLAPKYARLLGMYGRARMFGFSATPSGRMDGRDLEAEALFGPVLYQIPYQEAQAAGRVVPITVEWLRVLKGPNVSGFKLPALKAQHGVWRNEERNRVIAERVRQFAPDEQVLVMVKTIDHAVRLRALLPDFTLCYAAGGMDQDRIDRYAKQGLLARDEPLMTVKRRDELRRAFAAGELKKVISNYVWSTGVNFVHLGVLVRADAAGSAINDGQIPGRVCRRVPGVKESALLVDCWDEWDNGFLRKSQSRRRNYQQRGWAQVYASPTERG